MDCYRKYNKKTFECMESCTGLFAYTHKKYDGEEIMARLKSIEKQGKEV